MNSNKSDVRLILRYQGEGRFLGNLYSWNKEVVIFCNSKKKAEDLVNDIKHFDCTFCENGRMIDYSIIDDSFLGRINEIIKSDIPQEDKNKKLIALGVNRRERKLLLR